MIFKAPINLVNLAELNFGSDLQSIARFGNLLRALGGHDAGRCAVGRC
jgi:hypothetical protein